VDAWANIVVSEDDPEIAAIDELERGLGELPDPILGVRQLITRFEACHFKARRHYRHILDSIEALRPAVSASEIGAAHPRHGPAATAGDATGRARMGEQYVAALRRWLDAGDRSADPPERSGPPVSVWLGTRSGVKERLVRLLLARLLYKPLDDYLEGGDLAALEYQAMATDICCYAFPDNLERVIQAIGRLEALPEFDGCGTSTPEIDAFLSSEVERLLDRLRHEVPAPDPDADDRRRIRLWLVACLAKTLKEQGRISVPLPRHPGP
jgi:hypothetical protein